MFMNLLSADQQQRIRALGVGTMWHRGDHLMYQGTSHDAVHILQRGWVKVWAVEDGNEQVLDILGPGEILGELEMIGEVPRLCWITALQDVHATTISPHRFTTLAHGQHEILWAILQTVIIKFRDEHELRMQPDGTDRLLALLVRLADRYGHQQKNDLVFVPVPLSRKTLASWSRLSPSTCGRILRSVFAGDIRFQPDGLVFSRTKLPTLAPPRPDDRRQRRNLWCEVPKDAVSKGT
jgi:CRP-like cAMP-binding protein